jgi:hypothetical protein
MASALIERLVALPVGVVVPERPEPVLSLVVIGGNWCRVERWRGSLGVAHRLPALSLV